MTIDLRALREAMHSAPGTAYINRCFSRSFSLNIFQTNAQELIAAAWQMRDPDQGLRLMALDNKEAGQQAHREINRLVHNFVTGSKTLIDHTRAFIEEHYSGTPLKDAYADRVKSDFASEPVAKFVQDLRNYMVHKGLPASHMFIHFDNTSSGQESGGELTTGVRYATSSLLEWDGWTAPARAYIEGAGEDLDIHTFVESYLEKVLIFHQWLDTEFWKFHATDLAQLQEMQEAYARLSAPPPVSVEVKTPLERSSDSGDAFTAAEPDPSKQEVFEIDETGRDVLSKIRQLNFPPQAPDAFPSERPVAATITDDEIRGVPVVWREDSDGRLVVAFIMAGTEIFGLDADSYAKLNALTDKILQLSWAKQALSRKFIEEAVLEWLRSSFQAGQTIALSDAICAASRDHVKQLDVWVPIAYLEVENSFEFGPVKIAPITAAMMNELEAKGVSSSPNQRDDISALFDSLRSRMQGYAAVVVHVEAEPSHANEDGITIAQNAVGLLRFFAPTAREAGRITSTAPLGSEFTPQAQALVLGEDHFSFTGGLISHPFSWRLSRDNLSLLWPGLEAASKLILSEGLSEFSLSTRASLLLYSTGTTLQSHADRLIYTLSAVEGILLKHSMEATEFNIEGRMALLLTSDKQERQVVARNVREAYRLRKRHGAFVLRPYDEDSLTRFTHNAYLVLLVALENVGNFVSKTDFIDAIDRRKTIAPT